MSKFILKKWINMENTHFTSNDVASVQYNSKNSTNYLKNNYSKMFYDMLLGVTGIAVLKNWDSNIISNSGTSHHQTITIISTITSKYLHRGKR